MMFLLQQSTNNGPQYPTIATLAVLTLFTVALCFYYSKALKKSVSYDSLPKVAFLIFITIQWLKRNTYQILGKSYKKAVPFFLYIIVIFWFSSVMSITGLQPLGGSVAICFSLAAVVFVGTVLSGIIHRGYRFFGDYFFWIKIKGKKMIPIFDPLKLIGEISKILSLACRVWGNTLAGALILFLLYHGAKSLFSNPLSSYVGATIAPFFVFPLHIYFDIIHGGIQTYIFIVLTMSYWALARHGEGVSEKVNYDVEPEKVPQHNVH